MPSRSHSGICRLAACGAAASATVDGGSAQIAPTAINISLDTMPALARARSDCMQPPSWLQRDDLSRGMPASRVNTYAHTNAFRKKRKPR
jgi:hypothetical protein